MSREGRRIRTTVHDPATVHSELVLVNALERRVGL